MCFAMSLTYINVVGVFAPKLCNQVLNWVTDMRMVCDPRALMFCKCSITKGPVPAKHCFNHVDHNKQGGIWHYETIGMSR